MTCRATAICIAALFFEQLQPGVQPDRHESARLGPAISVQQEPHYTQPHAPEYSSENAPPVARATIAGSALTLYVRALEIVKIVDEAVMNLA
jgi:hypothetical protein